MNIGGTLIAGPAKGPLKGNITVPGDKSMSHRAIMLGALAEGVTKIEGFLPGDDNFATAAMFEAMGAKVTWLNAEKTTLTVEGVGLYGLKEPENVLDAGNSGTAARLITGILAGQDFHSVMVGDASLHSRPMQRVADPVRVMGATVDGREGGHKMPLSIRGGQLKGIDFVSPVASAQVKSCVLLAGLFADGETTVTEPKATRDHTERMLPLFGQAVERIDALQVRLKPAGKLVAPKDTVKIPADPSSATFFAVAASLIEGSDILLDSIGINPRRDGWRRVLADMQADLSFEREGKVGAEPVADIRVQAAALQGMQVNPDDIPDAIDEFPVLFVAAALSQGTFVLQEAEELRVKESDRIATMVAALQACGANIEEKEDGVIIQGKASLNGGVTVDAHGDHRIAMAMAVAAQKMDSEIRIENAAAIATSFPSFVDLAQNIGMNVRWEAEV
ncbi:MAG: 3-phosphoshikimate 1-carboxyvinyltransferase [Mariprofundaceae bacterium]|nr:3-phosphoshikimate 1-carboxyvinyltransferase [Mariprofundaceae bacterium]